MKLDAAKLAIVNAWDAAWTVLYGNPPSVPYVLDNEQAIEPNPLASWLRFSIRPTTGQQMTQGRPARYRRQGTLFVQVFTPIDQGTEPSDVLVRQVIDALEAQTIGALSDCVTTYGASPRQAPSDGQWNLAIVTVPFDFWETK